MNKILLFNFSDLFSDLFKNIYSNNVIDKNGPAAASSNTSNEIPKVTALMSEYSPLIIVIPF